MSHYFIEFTESAGDYFQQGKLSGSLGVDSFTFSESGLDESKIKTIAVKFLPLCEKINTLSAEFAVYANNDRDAVV